MQDFLCKISLQAYTTNQRINSLLLTVSIPEQLQELLHENKPISMIYATFPDLNSIELSFLNYWSIQKKDPKKNNGVLFHAPFPQELIQFLTALPCQITIDNQTQDLSFSNKTYIPKINLDIIESSILLDSKEQSLLLPSIIPYVIHRKTIKPLHILFKTTVIDDLFSHLKCKISVNESTFLLEESQTLDSPLHNKIYAPKLITTENISPIFEFHYNNTHHKYELSIFLDALIDNKTQRFPLHLESANNFLKSNEDFAILGAQNLALFIEKDNPIRTQIQTIVTKSFQNFYSLLGEIQDNKILTDDKVNFFEGFLPQITNIGNLYHIGKQKKLEFILSKEQPQLIITKATKTPLFGSIDWLSIAFTYNNKNLKLELSDLEKILTQGFLEIEDTLVAIPEDELKGIEQLLTLRPKRQDSEIQIQASFLPWILSIYPNATIPEEWDELKDFIQHGTIPSITIPQSTILRNYQKIGIERLALLYKFGFGMILADEMGLGKTLQILVFLDIFSHQGKTLIVTPTALLLNWVAEIQKFYPDRFKVLIVNGTKQQRDEKLKQIDDYDIIITSYHMLSFDLEVYSEKEFHFCIIDEAQHIKNANSKRSKSVKKINSRTNIAVSGTPLENNITELWSIFDFIMPNFLGTQKQFQQTFTEPMQAFDIEKRKDTLHRLHQLCTPFIIRRTKDTVYKELPPKIEQTILTELSDKQKLLYIDTLSRVREQFQPMIQENLLSQKKLDFLSALTMLRQISLHPGLVHPELQNEDHDLYSSKMTALFELLDDALENNHRVLIFSQFVSMLQIIQQALETKNIKYLYIDGKTQNRTQLTEEFNNSNVPIFLISLRAGGIGLNLTGADTVILFDPWWNPAIENQAIDRAHRIGQHKTVNIYRLMTKGTIEEKIYNLQRQKDFLFNNLMQENSNLGIFSSEELLSLISSDDIE